MSSDKLLTNVTSNITLHLEYSNVFKSLQVYFLSWYLPLVFLVGTVGNLFSIVFHCKRKLFPKIILIWLVSISLADFLILQTDALRMMLNIWTDFDIRDQSAMICRLHSYFSNFFFYWSAYNQAALSVQRLYFIMQPFQARTTVTFCRILIIWIVLLVLILLSNIIYLLYWDISSDGDCEPIDKIFYYTTTLFDMIISGIVPLAIMTVTTIWMSKLVFSSSKTSGVGSRQSGEVTRILVCMNVVYMLSTYPFLLYLMFLNFGTFGNNVGVTIPKFLHKFFYYLLRALCYLNTCANWIFYTNTGRVIRTRAAAIFKRSARYPANSEPLLFQSARRLEKVDNINKM